MSVEKLKSKKILEYENYFKGLQKGMADEELQRVSKTLLLIAKDKEMSKLEKPLELETLGKILGLVMQESSIVSKVSIGKIDPKELAGKITRWNLILDIFKSVWIIIDRKPAYQTEKTGNLLEGTKNSLVSDMIKLDSCIKSLEKSNPAEAGLLPSLRKELVG